MELGMCPLAADWGNWADWAAVVVGSVAAGGTIWVAWLARQTSERATRIAEEARTIAEQQHREAVLVREGNARIVSRLLVHEMSELPLKLQALHQRCERILQYDWTNLTESEVAFIEDTLRKYAVSVLPGTELSADRIHTLPDELGNDVAVLVGYSRTLRSMSEDKLQLMSVAPVPGIVDRVRKTYEGEKQAMANYQEYARMFSKYCTPTIAELRCFAGADPYDFSAFDINGADA